MARKVFVYIAASLDGYIAKHDEDLTFLSLVEQEGEDYGYAEFIAEMDARVARGAEALGVSSALQRAKATVEAVVAATTVPDPTTEQVRKLQAELQAKV